MKTAKIRTTLKRHTCCWTQPKIRTALKSSHLLMKQPKFPSILNGLNQLQLNFVHPVQHTPLPIQSDHGSRKAAPGRKRVWLRIVGSRNQAFVMLFSPWMHAGIKSHFNLLDQNHCADGFVLSRLNVQDTPAKPWLAPGHRRFSPFVRQRTTIFVLNNEFWATLKLWWKIN